MDQIIDEINENHVKIVNKIQDLEKKIGLRENTDEVKVTKKSVEIDIRVEKERLIDENTKLKLKVQQLISTLNGLEAKRVGSVVNSYSSEAIGDSPQEPKQPNGDVVVDDKQRKPKEKKTVKKEAKVNPNSDDSKPVDVSRLDLRVGRIINAKRHPDADSLYVEEIDCGEDKPRTVVSGLVRFVPLDQMLNRLVIVLCNLKAAKMRGITSEAMVMCASTPEKVELLNPPEGAQPGDRVSTDKYPGTCDSQLNPKKKVWETVAVDLKTNTECMATYKGEPLVIESKGPLKSQTLANVQIK